MNSEFIISSLVCLSDESGVPLRQLMESIGQENLEEIMTGAFLGEFMAPDEMAYEINRFCGLELSLGLPHRGDNELKQTGEALAKLVKDEEDLYSVLTSELASDISMALSPAGKAALPEPPSPEVSDEFYTTLLQLGREAGINWGTASDEEKSALAEMARLHVQIYYYPWRGDVLQFRVKEIFHLSAEVNTIAEGKERIEAALLEYAEECSANAELYRHHFRRRYHLPYMIWVRRWANEGELEKMLIYENEEEVRAALASPEKDYNYWQQLTLELEDEVAATYMSLAKKLEVNLLTASDEEKEELMEHVMYRMEREWKKNDERD